MPLARLLDFNDMKDCDVSPKDGLLFLQRKRKTGAAETHVVMQGETLYDIAQIQGIRLESLLQYNYITPGVQVEVGEKLYLHAPAPNMPRLAAEKAIAVKAVYKPMPASEQVATGNSDKFVLHTVQPKETMFSIAKKYDVSVDDVKSWNEMETSDVKIGQQIRINKLP